MSFDNKTGHFHYNPDYLEHAQWFKDKDDQLWIIPKDAEIEGPDGDLLDKLNAICRVNHGWIPETMVEQLGMIEVPHFLRRFDTHVGYYSA